MSIDWSSPLLLYEVAIISIGVIVLARVLTSTARVRMQNLRIMRGRVKEPAPVPTDSPVDDPTQVARDRAVKAIRAQTTVARRTLVPVVLVLTASLALVPALPEVHANLVTAIAAVIAVVLGIAARPLVENIIAGLVLASSRIFNIGDTVRIDEMYGTVEDITATHTVIKLWDWRRYLAPNSEMIRRSALNYTLHDSFLWAAVEFYVEYGADLDEVERIGVAAMTESEHFSPHEPPRLWVMGLGERSVRCLLAAWADTPADGWLLGHDARSRIARALYDAGVKTHGYQHHLEPNPPSDLGDARPEAQA